MSFPAEYVGRCRCGCGEYIDRGDLINKTMDGEYVLAGHEQTAHANRENPVCPKCNLMHAGECF
jgi:hypothetical protein